MKPNPLRLSRPTNTKAMKSLSTLRPPASDQWRVTVESVTQQR
jgi:hypothetical protein